MSRLKRRPHLHFYAEKTIRHVPEAVGRHIGGVLSTPDRMSGGYCDALGHTLRIADNRGVDAAELHID